MLLTAAILNSPVQRSSGAFGIRCHKAHDPSRLCDKVKERLRSGDIQVLNESQQHTLHIAMIEDGMNEALVVSGKKSLACILRHGAYYSCAQREYFEPFGTLKSVKIEPGKRGSRQPRMTCRHLQYEVVDRRAPDSVWLSLAGKALLQGQGWRSGFISFVLAVMRRFPSHFSPRCVLFPGLAS